VVARSAPIKDAVGACVHPHACTTPGEHNAEPASTDASRRTACIRTHRHHT
jgi:hypothetical protein